MGKIFRAGTGAGIFDKLEPELETDKNGPAPQHWCQGGGERCCGSARIRNFFSDPNPESEVVDPELDFKLYKNHKIL
jgi:hypothetical protein